MLTLSAIDPHSFIGTPKNPNPAWPWKDPGFPLSATRWTAPARGFPDRVLAESRGVSTWEWSPRIAVRNLQTTTRRCRLRGEPLPSIMIQAIHPDRDSIWDEFLQVWPPDRVASMTLDEYASSPYRETFTYWLEARTRELGRLWGGAGFRFGIFRMDQDNRREREPNAKYRSDGEYAWYAKYGNAREEAFDRIKRLILQVIEAARTGRIEDIESMELGRVLKWKIAFLYQERRERNGLAITPIFSKNALRFILDVPEKRISIAELQRRARRLRGGNDFWSFYEKGRRKWSEFEEARKAVLAFEGEEEYPDWEEPEKEGQAIEDWSAGSPGNLIFYGPPGTGKTHHLQNHLIPRYLAGERFSFVTFHPGYAYEDFVEGIRPEPDPGSGGLRYEVKPGVFRRICALAKADPSRRYALFIDEINRGNIAKVFGELITLIEDDKRCVYDSEGRLRPGKGLEATLPYSGDRFGVPANLDIYGTMNTADRSIASLDIALRRRFRFREMPPDSGKIEGAWGDGRIPDDEDGWLDLRAMLEALNRRLLMLHDRDHLLGQSYLMKCRSLENVRITLRDQILPLLREYFHEDYGRVQRVLGDLGPGGIEYPDAIIRSERFSPREFPGADDDDLPEGKKAYHVSDSREWSAAVLKRIYAG
jgi:5-methylcytosine-specific restriction endonuclease McrBC GTP-binding regulatory subunit McrB